MTKIKQLIRAIFTAHELKDQRPKVLRTALGAYLLVDNSYAYFTARNFIHQYPLVEKVLLWVKHI